MVALNLQRCLRHTGREAVARCPNCREYFCRECITEHDGQVICANCLELNVVEGPQRGNAWRWPLRGLGMIAGLLATAFFFYQFGRVLVVIPSSYHEGTVWKNSVLEDSE